MSGQSQSRARDTNRKVVLVVDDDADIRAALAGVLANEGFAVIEAKDGRLAEALLERQWPDAIISDIRIPHVDGVQLLEGVRKVSRVPFILMTGFSDVMEVGEAQSRGATDFILKPFKKDELLATLEIALNKAPDFADAVDEESLDFDFCRLSIDEFVSGRVSLADIFVRLSESKYVKVARSGSDLSLGRINAYKAKGLEFLFIRKEDFAKYVGLNVELSKAVGRNNRGVTKPQRIRLLKHTSEVLIQDVYVNGASKEKLETARAMVEAIVSTLSEDGDLLTLLEVLQTHSDRLYAHSLGVALYSSMLAKHIGWTSAPTLFRVTMAGLLHDIGKKEIPREILEKPRHTLTNEERTLYETHPIRSKEILSSIRSVPGDVVQVAMHHHENATGRGFPYRLMKSKIHPLAKLVAVVNEFCQLALKSPGGESPVSAKEAIEQLWTLKRQELDPAFVRGLMELFDVEIPKDMPKSTLPALT